MAVVVLLVGTTMADAVGGIARSYRSVFENLGYEFLEINLSEKEQALREIKDLAHKDVVFAFSFMAMGTDILMALEGGKTAHVWEWMRIPYVSLYGDSPSYFFDRHVLHSPLYIALYGFPEHYALRKRLPHVNGLINTYAPTAIDVIAKEKLDFKKKAEGAVVILKNGNDPKKLKQLWTTSLPPKISTILLDLARELEEHINDKAATQIDDLVLNYFANRTIDIAPLTKLRLLIVAQLDDYMRRFKGTLLIESLLDLPVLLNGYGWDHIDFSGRRIQYVPGGHFTLSRTLLRECLATIDVSPNTGLAPHDRPLRAFGAYTLCLTNEQEFFSRELPLCENFFYRFDKDSIQARVADTLAHRERALEIGVTVAEAFMKKFPPELFARQLLELAALARFNQLPSLPEGLPSYFSWPPTKL
jgi:hypothetical protein